MSKSTFPKLKLFNPKRAIGWWLFKKSMMLAIRRGLLLVSAAASAIGIIFWIRSMNKIPKGYGAAGVVAGLLILLLAVRYFFKFKATVMRAVLFILIAGVYLAGSLYYILNRSV